MSQKKVKAAKRELKEVLEAGPTGSLEGNTSPYEAMGWMYGFLTRCAWDGKDIRKLDPNKLMALAEKDILDSRTKNNGQKPVLKALEKDG